MMAALADADPGDLTAHRNLGVVLNTLGRDLLQVGDAAGALAQFRRALPIAERGVAADTASPDARRDLAFTLRFVAAATDAMGDHAAALATYRRAIAVQRRGVTPATMHDGTRDDLAVLYGGTATALGALGRLRRVARRRTRGRVARGHGRHARPDACRDAHAARAPIARAGHRGAPRAREAGVRCVRRSRDVWDALRRSGKLPFADARGPRRRGARARALRWRVMPNGAGRCRVACRARRRP